MINASNITEYKIGDKVIMCCADVSWQSVHELLPGKEIYIITDENLYDLYRKELSPYKFIVIRAGEGNKTFTSVEYIIEKLLQLEAGKDCCVIGFGGGMITDITGYVASVYKRGVDFALVPTSLMAMADAAIGGKNGVNIGNYKNIAGTITQPLFILYDYSLLNSLPAEEWNNGIAEIIKLGCVYDALLFEMLERYTIHQLQTDISLAASLIERSLSIKMKIVSEDEHDIGNRRILNFGHTIGHAIERLHDLPHGQAVSIGMVCACTLSEKLSGLHFSDAARIVKLLAKYQLPVDVETDHRYIFNAIKADKKRTSDFINFILLEKIGKVVIHPVSVSYLQNHLKEIL